MRSQFRIFIVGILVLILCGFIWICGVQEAASINSLAEYTDEELLRFSVENAFIQEGEILELVLDRTLKQAGAEVYYTLDGSMPTKESILYQDPIVFDSNKSYTCIPVRAVIYYKNEYSNIYCKTFFTESKLNMLDIDIISINIDSQELFDDTNGILVGQNRFSEGEEYIRPAYVEIINPEGELITKDNLGLYVKGNSSRYYEYCSLGLCADKQYGSLSNRIYYPINNDKETTELHRVTEYKKLTLHAGSQDWNALGSNIRASIATRLAAESGMKGVYDQKRAVVFLNGDFYALVTVKGDFSESFLKERFGINEASLLKYQGSETHGMRALQVEQFLQREDRINSYIANIENNIDVIDYLTYYAIEIMLNNIDWPFNSTGMWKVLDSEEGNRFADKKIRMLLNDVDLIYADLYQDVNYMHDNFETVLNTQKCNFGFLLKHNRYKYQFVSILCDLMNTSFTDQNIYKVVMEENNKIQKALKFFYYEKQKTQRQDTNALLQCAMERKENVIQNVKKYLDFDEMYTLEVSVGQGAAVRWNNMEILGTAETARYRGKYYMECPFKVTVSADPGYAVGGWLVNGETQVQGETLLLSDEYIREGQLVISPIVYPCEEGVVINEFSASGGADWIELYNGGTREANLSGWFLSDREDNLTKYSLNGLKISPEETMLIYCKNNSFVLSSVVCNFNISPGETIFLSKDGNIIDKVYCPLMADTESYGRYEDGATWCFWKNPTPGERNMVYYNCKSSAVEDADLQEMDIVEFSGLHKKMSEAFQRENVQYKVLIIPSCDSLKRSDMAEQKYMDLIKALQTEEVQTIDALSYFKNNGDKFTFPLYNEVGNYNDYGQYIIYKALCFNSALELFAEDFAWEMSFSDNDCVEKYLSWKGNTRLLNETGLVYVNAPKEYKEDGLVQIYENNNALEERTCVYVTRDFSETMMLYLANTYSRLIYIVSDDIPYNIALREEADVVIVECIQNNLQAHLSNKLLDIVVDGAVCQSIPENSVRCEIQLDEYAYDNSMVRYRGVTHFENINMYKDQIRILLVQGSHTLEIEKVDVNTYSTDLQQSRFEFAVDRDLLPKGSWQVCLLIEDKTGKQQVVQTAVYVVSDSIEPVLFKESGLADAEMAITYNLDEIFEDNNGRLLRLKGYAFVDGHEAVTGGIRVVLANGDMYYPLCTQTVIRKDLNEYFSEVSVNLEQAGFEAFVDVELLRGAAWNVLIAVDDGTTGGYITTYAVLSY